MIARPMLAAKIGPDEIDRLKFPLLATPKLDGIRCLVLGGRALSRKLKLIPNLHIQAQISRYLPDGLDGELMLSKGDTFGDISSAVMSVDGEPKFRYHVFDYVTPGCGLDEPYANRVAKLKHWYKRDVDAPFVRLVEPKLIKTPTELEKYEWKTIAEGFEGVCLRTPESPYKCGRSTVNEGWLVALKRFVDAEAVIIGFEEQEENLNEAKRDEVGSLKRSSHKAGKRGKGTLGAFVCKPAEDDGSFRLTSETFRIGAGRGLTDVVRQEIWDNRAAYLGKLIKFRYQEHGMKDKPRIPVFLGFRDARDT